MSTVAADPLAATVLVVDDHQQARQSMADILRCAGYETTTASSAIDALRILEQAHFDVILTDLRMPGMSGLQLVESLNRRSLDSQVVMITAHASVDTAVQAMRHGAFDYLEKPIDAEQLENVVERALRQAEPRRSDVPRESEGPIEMIGESRVMCELRARLQKVGPTDETVLIVGESGVGKELVARSLHQLSRRAAGPLVSVNCPAMSPQLMESELFGHVQGAFTSAEAPRVGRFELADGGTLLLDEITEIESHLQAKLLRVLQEREYERVGDSQSQRTDVRVIAATNRDLAREVAEKRFRQDLYYRLAVVPLTVLPLRERREDILLLASHFAMNATQRLGQDPISFQPDALELLQAYDWPGNVRELENLITRAAVLSEGGAVDADVLRPWLIASENDAATAAESATFTASVEAGMNLQQMERQLIEATLQKFDGHREKTAKALGIGVRTLTNKLRSYGYAPRANSPSAA